MAEMPELVELHKEMEKEGVRVQTVALDIALPQEVTTAEGIRDFAAERGFDLPIVAFDGNGEELFKSFEMRGALPTTLALAPGGEIVDRQVGPASKERFAEMVAKARGD